ncbi:MAG: ABC transporter substrate-binding protein [Sphingomonas sp.]
MNRVLVIVMIAVAMLSGCNRRADIGPVVVSAIGDTPKIADASRVALDTPSRILLDSTAQGLVRFDAAGQIVPGLAERWIVIDDGRSYIFRLRETEWSDGERVTAAEVVKYLARQMAPGSRNPLAPYLTAIDEIVEMTPQVIEVRLKRPRPDLLKLFAQPELAVLNPATRGGTGPFRRLRRDEGRVLLRPSFDPARVASEEIEEPGPESNVQLIGEGAARAITRFTERQSDLVLGGSFNNWPVVALVDIAPTNLHVDPAAGLFGLAIVDRSGFLAEAQNRAALAQAIDRAALVAAFAPGWAPTEQILPNQLDSAAPPAVPAWAQLSSSERRSGARARVMRWRDGHAGKLILRIALPSGPGATTFFGFVGAAFRSIGIEPRRVAWSADADLRLIDSVAPYDSARWYLARACQLCSEPAIEALDAARDAPTLAERAQHLAKADAAINDDAAFIPIARPLRWSLVAERLKSFAENSRAWHPLNALRRETR